MFDQIFNKSFSNPGSFVPTNESILGGIDYLKHNKTATITGYFVKIFDMSTPEDVKEYTDTMLSLTKKIQTSECVIWCNEKALVPTKDGTQTWKRYLEWSTYEISKESENE